MILIGQYDSPFVRRVAVAMSIYGLSFEHRPWSTFSDAAQVSRFNPLTRVPTLVLDGGESLIESDAIIDHLDELAGRERALYPPGGAARRRAMRICALGAGVADAAVSLFYEKVFHREPSEALSERRRGQIARGLDALEAERKATATPFWFGASPGHADIMVSCALRFLREAHPTLFDASARPALAGHAVRCEGLPAFRDHAQACIPPA